MSEDSVFFLVSIETEPKKGASFMDSGPLGGAMEGKGRGYPWIS